MALSTRLKSAARSKLYGQIMSKREVKIAAVEWAISALLAVDTVDKEERKEQGSAKLREVPQSSFLDGFFKKSKEGNLNLKVLFSVLLFLLVKEKFSWILVSILTSLGIISSSIFSSKVFSELFFF